jgi:hypothetical protein
MDLWLILYLKACHAGKDLLENFPLEYPPCDFVILQCPGHLSKFIISAVGCAVPLLGSCQVESDLSHLGCRDNTRDILEPVGSKGIYDEQFARCNLAPSSLDISVYYNFWK